MCYRVSSNSIPYNVTQHIERAYLQWAPCLILQQQEVSAAAEKPAAKAAQDSVQGERSSPSAKSCHGQLSQQAFLLLRSLPAAAKSKRLGVHQG